MKLIKLSGQFLSYLIATACFVLVFSQVNAQQVENKAKENKTTEIIIIEESVDENGNKKVNRKVLKGGDLTDEEIEKMIQKEIGGTIDIQKSGDGNEEITIMLEDEGDSDDRGYLGVMGEKGEGGVIINDLSEGSAAGIAGLKVGDLITALDDNPMSSLDGMIDYLKDKKPGEEVIVTFVRDHDTSKAAVSLGSKSKRTTLTLDLDDSNNTWTEDKNEFILEKEENENHHASGGAEKHLNESKPRLGVFIEANEEQGVNVIEVIEGSLAEKLDIRVGDIITQFNGMETNDPKALVDAVQSAQGGEKVKMQFLRDGKKTKKKLTLK